MRAAIMQPNFIPWMGYFKLIEYCDLFIFLDDVEYSKNTWHNRNNLLLRDGSIYLWTLPVTVTSNSTKLNETFVNLKSLKIQKLKSLLVQNYKKSENYEMIECILSVIQDNNIPLSVVNETIIKHMMQYLGIETPTLKSSDLMVQGVRSEKLIRLLDHTGAKTYVSVMGAQSYMELDNFSNDFNGEVEFFKYSCKYSLCKLGHSEHNLSALNLILDV